MNHFFDITLGQLITIAGFVGSALLFVWRTASLHTQQAEQVKALKEKVDKHEVKIDEHTVSIADLSSLAKASEGRLHLLEQEMRDNRKNHTRRINEHD